MYSMLMSLVYSINACRIKRIIFKGENLLRREEKQSWSLWEWQQEVQRPRCFKNVKSLPCQYTAQKKSWMDSQIFEDWIRKIDQKLRTDGRKIALIIDNCPAHPHVSDLTNIQLIFLPPNTTSDQGVIRSLKTHYWGRVVRLLCRALDKGQAYPKISILQAIKILTASWVAVTRETIVNCFKKAGINTEAQHAAITDSDDPFKDLQEML